MMLVTNNGRKEIQTPDIIDLVHLQISVWLHKGLKEETQACGE